MKCMNLIQWRLIKLTLVRLYYAMEMTSELNSERQTGRHADECPGPQRTNENTFNFYLKLFG